ncbi:acyl-CoA-binding domain-containing protein 5A isoform X2 [Anabas testudineus]|uniref:acyl-CoA-binding domain-containing protein 5A isoform X2 n=1 Tax=Anabas testudineus TaxID=64144 RepID=UPI000E45A2A5|nr:acyl-CoA-binding domain-containing protein 5A isoform X2 [Anabas testudineus]
MEVDSVRVEDETRAAQLRFEAAVKVIRSLPPDGPFQPSNDMMLKFYSYYKQATVGPCSIPRPRFWDAVGKAKWDAWDSLGDMPKEAAMAAYVDAMKLILESMPMTNEVEELLRVLGPFYELVDEKKKITQISDLSTGFGTMLNSTPSKSVAKTIVRSMEMNGTLEAKAAQLKLKEVREWSEEEEQEEPEEDYEEEQEEDEDEDEEEEEDLAQKERKADSQPKEKGSSRRHKVHLSNGKVANGGLHLANGSHSRAALNSEDSQEGPVNEPLLNGHHADHDVDVSGPNHLASDSDSEVYCDSVDQIGQESSENNHSLDDTDEEENHALESQDNQEGALGPPHVIRCGGEDWETGGPMSQRHKLNADMRDTSLVRRGRGFRSAGHSSGALPPVHSGGDGAGSKWGEAVTPEESLNEQIVVVLARLQEDMQSVLERLHTLEALTTSQVRSGTLSPAYASPSANKRSQKPSWWPFDISPRSLAFAVIWPFVVQWLICLYLQRRRRRIN